MPKTITKYNLKKKKVWVAGHNGMVGKAIVKRLEKENCEILTVDKKNLNLIDQKLTFKWIENNKPDVVFLAAAKVGGILANNLNQKDEVLHLIQSKDN